MRHGVILDEIVVLEEVVVLGTAYTAAKVVAGAAAGATRGGEGVG